MIVEVFTDIAERHKVALKYQEIFSFFIEREDTDNLQKGTIFFLHFYLNLAVQEIIQLKSSR